MTKQDRQIWEAVIKRQEERETHMNRSEADYGQAHKDCDSLIEIITTIQNDVKRLERFKR